MLVGGVEGGGQGRPPGNSLKHIWVHMAIIYVVFSYGYLCCHHICSFLLRIRAEDIECVNGGPNEGHRTRTRGGGGCCAASAGMNNHKWNEH